MATQRVRICVVLNAAGSYNAAGWKLKDRVPDESLVREAAQEGLDEESPAERIYWLEATLYTPEEETVEATIQSQEEPTP